MRRRDLRSQPRPLPVHARGLPTRLICRVVRRRRTQTCSCVDTPAADPQEVWVRHMTDGDLAVAIPNWDDADAECTHRT